MKPTNFGDPLIFYFLNSKTLTITVVFGEHIHGSPVIHYNLLYSAVINYQVCYKPWLTGRKREAT